MTFDSEKAYNPRAAVPEWPQIIARWQKQSEAARKAVRCYLDVPYGNGLNETMDMFLPQGRSRATLMFIHGGFWRALDKKDHSFIAPAFTRAGVSVAVLNYALCPAVTVEHIVRQMLQGVAWLYRNSGNFGAPYYRLHLAGHSAGAHLTAMAMAALWPVFAPDLPHKVVQAGFCLSGLYDVAPLINVSANEDIRLTPAVAKRVSPAFMPPATDAPLYTAVGSEENEGFHVQNRLIAKNWKSVHKADVKVAGANHYTILDRFADSESEVHRAALAAIER